MSKTSRLASALAVLLGVVALGATPARATTINFWTLGTANTAVASPLYVSDPMTELPVLTAYGFYYNGTDWVQTYLFLRNDGVNDRGLGVCNSAEGAPNNCPAHTGDVNELDNAGQPELIVLELAPGNEWASLSLSSLDSNGNLNPEQGVLFGTNQGMDAHDAIQYRHDNTLWQFSGSDSSPNVVGPVPAFDDATKLLKYLIIEPIDWDFPAPEPDGLTTNWFTTTTPQPNKNNDFLLNTAVVNQPRVPEPASFAILLAGLGALGFIKRRSNG